MAIVDEQIKPAAKPAQPPTVGGSASPVATTPAKAPLESSGYKAPTTTPISSEVDKDTGTVAGQLNDLTASGSTYTNLAKSDAIRQSNSRGLINSTMAGAAGTEAAIRAGLPIAQADAKTYNDTRLKNQEYGNDFLKNQQSAELNVDRDVIGSELRKGEMELGSELSNEENTLLNDLTMKRDDALSTLTQAEQAQLNDLTMKRDAALSGLTNEQNTLLNELATKRDNNASSLTKEENAQLATLEALAETKKVEANKATATKLAETDTAAATASALADLKRDTEAGKINENKAVQDSIRKIAEMTADSDLRKAFEDHLVNTKLGADTKMQIIQTINKIQTDTAAQIAQIGTTDRTAAQQTAAIKSLEEKRDATLRIYESLLASYGGWEWGTDFGGGPEPEPPTEEEIAAEEAAAAAAAAVPPAGMSFSESIQWFKDQNS